ncbi:hypothetical protein [uncultured Kiloniella sp.]|uniref:hypothetical protein n=1 Tax=uncultured Kiloniella sp. TaxID=1133091 RepID=UPI00260B84EE|nr:hypothetical protein [uncultured Kiloniella sp.]
MPFYKINLLKLALIALIIAQFTWYQDALASSKTKQLNKKIGTSRLVYSKNIKIAFQRYINEQGIGNQYLGTAMALDPKTGKSVSSFLSQDKNAASQAQVNALKECGDQCYLFAIGREIVWINLIDPATQQKIAPELRVASHPAKASYPKAIKYYKPELFELTIGQSISLMHYAQRVSKVKAHQHAAFVVSNDGSSALAINTAKKEAQHNALRDCEIRSPTAECYLYAINKKILFSGEKLF